jgi:hypothetical protein
MGSQGDTLMSMKKLSLKKETLLPMNDDQAQTIAGGIIFSNTCTPANGAAAICSGLRCSDPCKTDFCTNTCNTCATNCGTCATCATCATNCGTCGTCATNCNCGTVAKTCDTCRTDCVCPTNPPANGGAILCKAF